jgi:hypothetical protein
MESIHITKQKKCTIVMLVIFITNAPCIFIVLFYTSRGSLYQLEQLEYPIQYPLAYYLLVKIIMIDYHYIEYLHSTRMKNPKWKYPLSEWNGFILCIAKTIYFYLFFIVNIILFCTIANTISSFASSYLIERKTDVLCVNYCS